MRNFYIFIIYVIVNSCQQPEPDVIFDFTEITSTGSPYIFGATQPRGLSDNQWDIIKSQGFTFARSQADLTKLVPVQSLDDYLSNEKNCTDPGIWDWDNGIYGNDFVKKAMQRDMQVCLVIKNATWNRYKGAPLDEETIPKDMNVWKDILIKIINRYKGGITYIEFYNEVDREPQFLIEGSGYSRKEGYRALVRKGLEAIEESEYPETLGGGPAAAGTGEEQVRWMLEDEYIKSRLGCITFHQFDNPVFPEDAIRTYQNLMEEFDINIPVIRSSFVPEFNRNEGYPGTLKSAYIAVHLIGAMKSGLKACGLWEIQNKESEDDVRYWFDGDSTVQTAFLYNMMSNKLALGEGESRIAKDTDPLYHWAGGINHKGEKFIIVTNPSEHKKIFYIHLTGIKGTEKNIEFYSGTSDIVYKEKETIQNGVLKLNITVDKEDVVGLKFD